MPPLTLEMWRRLLARRPADAVLCALYGKLTAPDGCFVLGRIAQSLDGGSLPSPAPPAG